MSRQGRTYTRRSRWFLASLALVAALTFWGGTFSTDSGAPPSRAQQVFCWVGVLAFVAVGVRTARLGVRVGDSGIEVRNLFRTYRFTWPEIASAAGPPPYGKKWQAGIQLHLCSGRTVSASAFVRGPGDDPEVASDVVRAIQEHLPGARL